MKRNISRFFVIGITMLSLACAKSAAPESGENAERTLAAEMESFSQTPEGRNAAPGSDGTGGGIVASTIAFLNAVYGYNPSITRVAIGAIGTQMTQPNVNGNFPTAAQLAIFDKGPNGFQLTSGNPTQIRSIPYSALYVFLAQGIIPVAAGAAAFCAGVPGRTVQSGAIALGLGISSYNGRILGFAGSAFRSGNYYQVCNTYGCSAVTTVPIQIANLFPVCDGVLQ